MNTKSVYKDREGTNEEIDFQKAFQFLFDVSIGVIGDNEKVWEKTILDVGAGGNPALGLELGKRSAVYTAFDANTQFLDELSKNNLSVILGDILSYNFSESYDIVHIRNMLMHMSEENLLITISNVLSLAQERVVFLEPDWKTFVPGGDATQEFRDFSLELISDHGDPFVANKLLNYVGNVACKTDRAKRTKHSRFYREADAYYYEIIPLVKMMIKIMEQMNHKLLEYGKEVLEIIIEESRKDSPETFVPPDIVCVEVIF